MLDEQRLTELALAYVGRFATTRAKLSTYLQRKVRERGWSGEVPPDIGGIAERFASRGYIDDAAFALMKARSLTGRGYGPARVNQSLRVAGVDEDDAAGAKSLAEADALQSALRFARRRRLGPYAEAEADPKARQRALAAMTRAGHSFSLSRAIIDAPPGTSPETLASEGGFLDPFA